MPVYCTSVLKITESSESRLTQDITVYKMAQNHWSHSSWKEGWQFIGVRSHTASQEHVSREHIHYTCICVSVCLHSCMRVHAGQKLGIMGRACCLNSGKVETG